MHFISAMVEYRKHVLDNGLTVLTHEAWNTPLASVDLLYGVGSRDEEPSRTGFAHLFEHLMFGGTPEVPDFDGALSSVGGDSNAFTSHDYTLYYETLPADSLSVALRLEADRMTNLDISQHALEVQQRVVTEEYNQRYMNQPYGDVWLLLRPLCFKRSPYRWNPIGADIRHVSEATLEDVRAFHGRYYRPDNAFLAIAAPLSHEAMLRAVEDAFRGVKRSERTNVQGVQDRCFELPQEEARYLRVERRVPASKVFLAWPMCGHFDPRFRACDLLSDLLGTGTSSRLHSRLVRERGLFTEADACITGDAGEGLIMVEGRLSEGVSLDEAAEALRTEVRAIADGQLTAYELEKVQNKYASTFALSQYKAADRALALCHYTWLGDTDLINREPEEYGRLTVDDIVAAARDFVVDAHENRLDYVAI